MVYVIFLYKNISAHSKWNWCFCLHSHREAIWLWQEHSYSSIIWTCHGLQWFLINHGLLISKPWTTIYFCRTILHPTHSHKMSQIFMLKDRAKEINRNEEFIVFTGEYKSLEIDRGVTYINMRCKTSSFLFFYFFYCFILLFLTSWI